MAFWETVFKIILLLFAARVCSTSQPAQEWMHHDQQTSLEVTLINALHTDKTNQEQLSSYFCTPQLLLNVSFLIAIAPQHIRTKRINWQEDEYLSDETRSYSFLITTSPLLKAVHPQFFCLLQPQLLFSKQLWSEPCFNPPKVELSLYVQYMAASMLDRDIQTALKRMLQKVSQITKEAWNQKRLYTHKHSHIMSHTRYLCLPDVFTSLLKNEKKGNGNTISYLDYQHIRLNFIFCF